jgi:hypothetical protein
MYLCTYVVILTKYGLGYILADFLQTCLNHPDSRLDMVVNLSPLKCIWGGGRQAWYLFFINSHNIAALEFLTPYLTSWQWGKLGIYFS